MKKAVTLNDIAKAANVSMNTVSKVLNGKGVISESTRKKILSIAQEYDYHPNISARTMRGVESPLIGVVVSDMEDPFFVQVISGIEERAWKEGMSIIIGNSAEDLEKQRLCIENHLSYGCRNMIVMPVDEDPAPMRALQEKNIRLVLADRLVKCESEFHMVTVDNKKGAFDACEYLIGMGHTKIAIINQQSAVTTETDRTDGYKEALKKHGITVRDEYVRLAKNEEEAAQAAAQLMSLPDKPTALFIAKDRLSLHVVRALNEIGVSFPDDLSIMIYGCPHWSQTFRPYFTCMQRPIKEIGITAAEMIIDMIKNGTEQVVHQKYFCASLMERDTVKKLI